MPKTNYNFISHTEAFVTNGMTLAQRDSMRTNLHHILWGAWVFAVAQ